MPPILKFNLWVGEGGNIGIGANYLVLIIRIWSWCCILSADELWQPDLVCWCCLIFYEAMSWSVLQIVWIAVFSMVVQIIHKKEKMIACWLFCVFQFKKKNCYQTRYGNVVMNWSLIKCNKFRSSVKELTVTLLLVPCTSCSTWDLCMYDSLNTFGFNNTCGYPTYASYNKYQPIIFCEPSSCVSPWYNRTGWLGVKVLKHQHTYLPLMCQGSRFFPCSLFFAEILLWHRP